MSFCDVLWEEEETRIEFRYERRRLGSNHVVRVQLHLEQRALIDGAQSTDHPFFALHVADDLEWPRILIPCSQLIGHLFANELQYPTANCHSRVLHRHQSDKLSYHRHDKMGKDDCLKWAVIYANRSAPHPIIQLSFQRSSRACELIVNGIFWKATKWLIVNL